MNIPNLSLLNTSYKTFSIDTLTSSEREPFYTLTSSEREPFYATSGFQLYQLKELEYPRIRPMYNAYGSFVQYQGKTGVLVSAENGYTVFMHPFFHNVSKSEIRPST